MQIGREIDAAITQFEVVFQDSCTYQVIVGNMHIVCGTRNAPSIRIRQDAVVTLRKRLEGIAASEENVIRIIVGDDNLSSRQVREALQSATDEDPVWAVYSSHADLSGDHVAVC